MYAHIVLASLRYDEIRPAHLLLHTRDKQHIAPHARHQSMCCHICSCNTPRRAYCPHKYQEEERNAKLQARHNCYRVALAPIPPPPKWTPRGPSGTVGRGHVGSAAMGAFGPHTSITHRGLGPVEALPILRGCGRMRCRLAACGPHSLSWVPPWARARSPDSRRGVRPD